MRTVVSVIAVVAVGIASLAAVQTRIDRDKERRIEDELLYLPNDKLLDHFTAGLSNIVADLLWIKTIQYTAKEFHNVDRKYTWLEHMCQTVTRLDPHFLGAYENAGILMAAIGNDTGAERILKQGIPDNPDAWQLPFELAKIYLLNRREHPESAAMSMHYLNMTAERSETPDAFADWAARIHKFHNLDDVGEEIWEAQYKTAKDDFMKELALARLHEIRIRRSCDDLTRAALQFDEEHGRVPTSLDELVTAGVIAEVPQWDVGNEYFVNENCVVTNSYVLDIDTEALLRYLAARVEIYKREQGHFPESLEVWAEYENRSVPAHPYTDREWGYDPNTGEVSSKPKID